jgi:hypothetical protein
MKYIKIKYLLSSQSLLWSKEWTKILLHSNSCKQQQNYKDFPRTVSARETSFVFRFLCTTIRSGETVWSIILTDIRRCIDVWMIHRYIHTESDGSKSRQTVPYGHKFASVGLGTKNQCASVNQQQSSSQSLSQTHP